MSILVYANSGDPAVNDRLLGLVESKASDRPVESFRSIESFTERVCRLPRRISVAVLMARNDGQLNELIALKDYLEDIPIILILPHQGKELIALATKLYPNFISSLDIDLGLTGEVLERMIRFKEMKICREKSSMNTS